STKATTAAAPTEPGTQQRADKQAGTAAATAAIHQYHDEHQQYKEEDRHRTVGGIASLTGLLLEGVTSQHLDYRLCAAGDARCKIFLLECWRDDWVDNDRRLRIGQSALQTVAHFDADLALIRGDNQQRTVVLSLLANAPVATQLVAELLD